jgi:hypothetical protein
MRAPREISYEVRQRRRALDDRHIPAAPRRVDRAADADAVGADLQAALAAIRHLFDWLVTGQIVPHNAAASVRGPAHSTKMRTPVLDATEARQLVDSVDVTAPIGLRDRVADCADGISFAQIGAALAMRVNIVYHSSGDCGCGCAKRAKAHAMPCQRTLEA